MVAIGGHLGITRAIAAIRFLNKTRPEGFGAGRVGGANVVLCASRGVHPKACEVVLNCHAFVT